MQRQSSWGPGHRARASTRNTARAIVGFHRAGNSRRSQNLPDEEYGQREEGHTVEADIDKPPHKFFGFMTFYSWCEPLLWLSIILWTTLAALYQCGQVDFIKPRKGKAGVAHEGAPHNIATLIMLAMAFATFNASRVVRNSLRKKWAVKSVVARCWQRRAIRWSTRPRKWARSHRSP